MSRSFILRSAQQEEVATRLSVDHLLLDDSLIANPSSKASLINQRTSHHREEDDSLGDESPPLESVLDVMKSLLLLRGPEDEAP
ncbi:unnamed protein product [Spirodela intermedia]|uniref:Uncharacterized protein n=1 Tax=Spirodela intermedia TaxID=51605 RepID=A0A7I8JJZ5_SPIIN|nr:unnamed protein product [Spirodela intermedia]CAA6670464.1 unnamed protein product [Spirodela intermedia]